VARHALATARVTVMRRLVPWSTLLWMCACSTDRAQGVSVTVSGPLGEPLTANEELGIFVVPVSVNGVPGSAVVDTGSPIVALDPASFVAASVPNGSGTIASLALGDLSFTALSVVGGDLLSSPDPSVPIEGSIGCTLLCAFAVSFDYRAGAVTLSGAGGGATRPSGVETPGVTLPFTLAGGGTTMLAGVPGSVVFPPSRIVMSAMLEGTARSLVVDTGASYVLVRQSIESALAADGRTVLAGVATSSVGAGAAGGSSTSVVTRGRSLSVGGQEVDGLVLSADSSLEPALDSLASEVGGEVDGLIGGSYLRQFFVTVDYPGGALGLRRYTSGGPTYDLFDRVGVGITPATGGIPATVAVVFPGTAAASQGVAVGDALLAIDGMSLTTLGGAAIDALLAGPVGSTKSLTFGAAASPMISMQSVTIAVDDVLSL